MKPSGLTGFLDPKTISSRELSTPPASQSAARSASRTPVVPEAQELAANAGGLRGENRLSSHMFAYVRLCSDMFAYVRLTSSKMSKAQVGTVSSPLACASRAGLPYG